MEKIYECGVIGGGASGMMAAISAAEAGVSVVLMEHNSKLGVKLAQTGNGKCNFTNYDARGEKYPGDNQEFIDSIIGQFSVSDTLAYFRSLGVMYYEERGCAYPRSNVGSSVCDALQYQLYECGVNVLTQTHVENLVYDNDLWCVHTNNDTYYFKKIIMATGSMAMPRTGSDGSGYKMAKALGHSIIKPLPALVQLVSDNPFCKIMAGVRGKCGVKLFVNNKLEAFSEGEVQFTDYGISGIPVFQISRYATKALNEQASVKAVVDMIEGYERDYLSYELSKTCQKSLHRTVEEVLSAIVNKKLVTAACKSIGIEGFTKVYKLGLDGVMKVVDALKNYEFNITDHKGFDSGQICVGGVSTKEVNDKTLESLSCEGLYFTGELLDVDGPCGGYNLQWAWSSGYVAGKAVARALQKISMDE